MRQVMTPEVDGLTRKASYDSPGQICAGAAGDGAGTGRVLEPLQRQVGRRGDLSLEAGRVGVEGDAVAPLAEERGRAGEGHDGDGIAAGEAGGAVRRDGRGRRRVRHGV